MTAFKVLKEDWFKCNSVYIQNRVNVRKELYHFDQVMAPNPKCYVCGDKPEVRSLKSQVPNLFSHFHSIKYLFELSCL